MKVKLDITPIQAYFFTIWENPRKKKKMLIFRGVGSPGDINEEVRINDEKYWTVNIYGRRYSRNYYDFLDIYGELPCLLIDERKRLVSLYAYKSQKDIAKHFDIELSSGATRKHDEYGSSFKRRGAKPNSEDFDDFESFEDLEDLEELDRLNGLDTDEPDDVSFSCCGSNIIKLSVGNYKLSC